MRRAWLLVRCGFASALRALAERPRTVAFCLVVALLASGVAASLGRYWSITDDHLQFLMTGAAVEAVTPVDEALSRTEAFMADHALQGPAVDSLAVRHDNLRTYLGTSAIYAATRKVFFGDAPAEPKAFAGYLVAVNLAGYLAATMLVAAAVVSLCRFSAGTAWTLAIALLVLWGPHMVFPWSGYAELGAEAVRFLEAALNPGAVWGVFGFTPKNTLILVALGVFVARVGGHRRTAYVLLVMALLVHRQMGMLLAALVLMADGVIRPKTLFDPVVALCVLVSVSYFLALESFWQRMGLSQSLGVAAGLTAVVGGYLAAWGLQRFHPAPAGPREPSANALADLVVFAAVYGAATLLAWFGYRSGVGSGLYFWKQLPIRLLYVVQPMAAVAVAAWVVNAGWSRGMVQGQGARLALMSMAFSVAVLGWFAGWIVNDFGRLLGKRTEQAMEIQQALPLGMADEPGYRDEDKIYMAAILDVWVPSRQATDVFLGASARKDLVSRIAHDDVQEVEAWLDEKGCEALSRQFGFPSPLGGGTHGVAIDVAAAWNARQVATALLSEYKQCERPLTLQPHCHALKAGHGSMYNLLSDFEPFNIDRNKCADLIGWN